MIRLASSQFQDHQADFEKFSSYHIQTLAPCSCMALILGIGVGLFILAVVWTVTILLSIVFFRVDKLRPAAGALILFSALLTLILTLYPREGATPEPADIVVTDETFMGRVVLLAFFSFFTLLSLGLLFVFHWTEPITARPIKLTGY